MVVDFLRHVGFEVRNELDGASWDLTAANKNGDETIRFRYRAGDLILYDPETNQMIGKFEPIKQGQSKVIFNEKGRFPSTFTIQNKGGGMWAGRANSKGEDWTVTMRRVTRRTDNPTGVFCRTGRVVLAHN